MEGIHYKGKKTKTYTTKGESPLKGNPCHNQ
jgi:hypothetical protein